MDTGGVDIQSPRADNQEGGRACSFSQFCLTDQVLCCRRENAACGRPIWTLFKERAMQRSKSVLTIVLLLYGFRAAQAQEAASNPDEAAIHQAAIAFVDAYNAKDSAAIAVLFGEQARVETADGDVVEGGEKIKAGFETVFKEEPEAQLSLAMDSLIFLTPEVAIEQGATEFFPDGEMLTTRSKYLVVHLKKDGKWKMISARSMGEEVISNYEYLRRLNFFVGDWIDEDSDSTVESKIHWDDGKNFLLHDFSVRRGGNVVQKGTQRIGWDPQAKRIRGWVFDSQGGFGETSWEEVDGSWVVKSSGVASTGESRTGTRTLTLEGDQIQVRLSDRTDQGQRLPDIDFTMVRKPPAPLTAAASPGAKGGAK
jgi:uncharacterized protein (TIGR02246 family)